MGFPTRSKKIHLALNRKWKSILTELKKTVVPENPKNNLVSSI